MRQARVLVYREITPEYKIPLGVWLIRETVRDAMKKKPVLFEDTASAVKHIGKRVKNQDWSKKSVILKNLRVQKTLEQFL
jgi:hypothetical protein